MSGVANILILKKLVPSNTVCVSEINAFIIIFENISYVTMLNALTDKPIINEYGMPNQAFLFCKINVYIYVLQIIISNYVYINT